MLSIWKDTTDISLDMENYTKEYSFGTLTDAQYIYVGNYKPINALYAHLEKVNTNSGTLSVEYYNGSTFTAVSGLVERTEAFTESGFIEWDRNQTDEAKTTVNSLEKYWYRISTDTTTTSLIFRALNLLFSSDVNIKEEAPYLLSSDYWPSEETSFVNYHQAARNEIIQRLRNEGYSAYNTVSGHKDLDIFDLNDYKQLQEASKYLVLSKIYFYLSDAPEDKYIQRSREFKSMYNDAFRTFFLSVDANDDGLQSKSEKSAFKSGVITRV